MIRVYFLQVDRIDDTDVIRGSEFCRHAILGVEGTLRKLIQNTTKKEHKRLTAVAESWRDATEDEKEKLRTIFTNMLVEPARNLYDEVDKLKAWAGTKGFKE